jgi:hypothetical protein
MPIIALRLPIHLRNRHPFAAGGLEGDIPNASVLHPHDDRPILKHGEVNPIAGLEVRSSPYVLGDRRLALTGHCGKRHVYSPILTIRNIVSNSPLLGPSEFLVNLGKLPGLPWTWSHGGWPTTDGWFGAARWDNSVIGSGRELPVIAAPFYLLRRRSQMYLPGSILNSLRLLLLLTTSFHCC